MRIGFDISQTGRNKAGCGFYADTLVRHLLEQYPNDHFLLYPTFGNTYWDPDHHQRIKPLHFPNVTYPIKHNCRDDSYQFWGALDGVDEVSIGSPEVIHANNFSSPRLFNTRLIYTVYDLSFIDLPECTTEENRQVCFNGMFLSSFLADMAIAISHYSKKRFLDNFPHFPPDRVVVAHLGNRLPVEGHEEIVQSIKTGTDFFLAVGTLEPRKNLKRLLKAYKRYAVQSETPKPLVLAGANGWLEEDLPEYIVKLQLQNLVITLGYVSDPTLRWLYKNCWAFIYPSLYEGFGLPVLEAMAAGTATITSNSSSLPEVGGDAVHYVDPLKEDSITTAFLAAEKVEYRFKLQEKGRLRAKNFSWEKTAETVYEVYKEAIRLPQNNRFALSLNGYESCC